MNANLTSQNKQWQTICSRRDLVANSGVCALIEDSRQVAIFQVENGSEHLYAIGNYDPIGKANVLYRGIVGCVKEEPVVASPLYKQHFSLITGKCIQDQGIQVDVFPVRLENDQVQLLV